MSRLEKYIRNQNFHLINNNWNKISKICETVKSSNIDAGPIFPTHYDLHPHNFLLMAVILYVYLILNQLLKFLLGFQFHTQFSNSADN